MSNFKPVLLVIVLIAVGSLVMPQTVSLFAGQHWWYNISGTGNQVPCQKCHADIYEEMRLHIGPHTGETGYVFQCQLCHRTAFTGFSYATVNQSSVTSVYPGKQAHAASTVRCLTCHGAYGNTAHVSYYLNTLGVQACYACHGNPSVTASNYVIAGGFGLTALPGDTGSMAAHERFVIEAKNNTTLRGANEACVACHTHVAVKIIWHHKRSLEFNVSINNPVTLSNGVHNWSVTNWKVNGTAVATVWGNASGNGSVSYNSNYWPWSNSSSLNTVYSSI
ncbi:MAG: hypothetical protein DSY33_02235 [Archaeoglobus sp.]|nr:MAG: hypothetical protein DSY33_02235 [Archaeoglobus sp.]